MHVIACLALTLLTLRALAADPIEITVDATDAPRRLFRATLVVPAAPGAFTLMYPKWIPGEHGPTGPIADLSGLRFSAGDKPVAWRRDEIDMYALHLDVPAGATSITAQLDYLSPTGDGQFTAGPSATPQLAAVSWHTLLLYPKSEAANQLTYVPAIKLPVGWRYGTALEPTGESGQVVKFAPVTLETLIDSPLVAGAHFRRVELTPGAAPPHFIDLVGDSAAALQMTPENIEQYKRLVAETGPLFGTRHYNRYDFLFTLSDQAGSFGLEHHQSSDNRLPERTLIEPDRRTADASLLPHEFVHSWNGKHRRPADMVTSGPADPMKTRLLWVYEGLTEYLGDVLTARCGLWKPEDYRDWLAMVAAILEHTPGRAWRPLEDTTVNAQVLYEASRAWRSARRGVDFYDEGELIWLEVDVLIRKQTNGAKSLNDFCRAFFGGPPNSPAAAPPSVKPYTFDELVAALNEVAAFDWRALLTTRLTSTDPRPPLAGIEGAGWKLVYTAEPNLFIKASEDADDITNLTYSIGISLDKDGVVRDAVPGKAAFQAGIGPGMKLIAVNGRKWSPDILADTLKAAQAAPQSIELLVENAEFFLTYRLDYQGGPRYPHLQRNDTVPDMLSEIIKPLAPTGK